MLAEWLRHLTTPAPRAAKKLGYVRELIAIEARHQRCRNAWAPHLERSRRFVLDAADGLERRRKVTLLGSGLLLDVPLAELAEKFTEVVLIDIVQMPAVRRQVSGFTNVRLVEDDLAGVVDDLAAGQRIEQVPSANIPDGDADLVVSLNLVTQLGVMLARRGVDAAALAAAHLAALRQLAGRVVMIAETERQWIEGGEVVESDRPLETLDLPEPDATWAWNLAPAPEIDPRRDRRFTIAAYADLSRNSTRAAP